MKENIKSPSHWPLCEEFTGDRWVPRTNRPVTRKTFPFDDVIMSDDAGKAVATCEHSVEFDCTLDLKLKNLLPMRPKFYT